MSHAFSLRCMDVELAARAGPAEWQRILELRDHPRILQGLYRYAELMPAYYDSNIMLNKVVTEAWRFHILVFALHLYDTRNPADPLSGLTVANLTRLCAAQQVASRGRVMAIIGIMRVAGYLKRSRRASGSRAIYLEPTDKFISIVEGWNHRLLQIIDAIDPTHDLAATHLADERFGWDMRERGAQLLLGGWKVLEPFPEVAHFVNSDGGWMLLLTCAANALRDSDGSEIAPVAIDLATFAPRFAVSRSHLRRLLETAYDLGLLDAQPPACIVYHVHGLRTRKPAPLCACDDGRTVAARRRAVNVRCGEARGDRAKRFAPLVSRVRSLDEHGPLQKKADSCADVRN